MKKEVIQVFEDKLLITISEENQASYIKEKYESCTHCFKTGQVFDITVKIDKTSIASDEIGLVIFFIRICLLKERKLTVIAPDPIKAKFEALALDDFMEYGN